MKKSIVKLLLVLVTSFSFSYSNVVAKECESNVTVRILHDDITEFESTNGKDNSKSSDIQKEIIENKELKKNGKLPKTNELINWSISLIGMLVLAIGLSGIYINYNKNGGNINEKN